MNLNSSYSKEDDMSNMISKKMVYERRWLILVVISLGVMTIVLSSSMVNIALPTIQREFSATMADLQWIVNAYMLLFAGLMLFFGAVADRIGHRLMFTAGLCAFVAANVGATLATTAQHIIIWRCVMGAGAAMLLPTTLAIVRSVFPDNERGKAIGVWAGLNSLGIALGPIIGGALVDGVSWKAIFLVNAPVGALAIILGLVLLPRGKSGSTTPIDLLGTLLSTAAISSLVYGLIRSGQAGWSDATVIVTLIGSVIGFVLFGLWESRTKYPLLNLSYFRNRDFASGVTSVFIMSFALVGITFTLTLFMQFVRGYSALQTGVRLLPLAAGIFVGAGSADNLVKRFGRRNVIASGFAGTAVSAFAVAFVTSSVAYWILGIAYFALGFFLGYIAAPSTDAIMGAAPEDEAGVVSSTNTVARTTAGAIGVALLGAILSSVYSDRFAQGVEAIQGVPEAVAGPATESIGGAIVVSAALPDAVRVPLIELSHSSFMAGWKVLAIISAILSLCGMLVALSFVPSRQEVMTRDADRNTGFETS